MTDNENQPRTNQDRLHCLQDQYLTIPLIEFVLFPLHLYRLPEYPTKQAHYPLETKKQFLWDAAHQHHIFDAEIHSQNKELLHNEWVLQEATILLGQLYRFQKICFPY